MSIVNQGWKNTTFKRYWLMTMVFGSLTYYLEWMKLENDDKKLICAVMIGYAIVKGLKLKEMDLDVFGEKTAVA